MVLSGRLGACLHNDEGKEVLIRQMPKGETVGEMAVLSGEPRSATVLALRDTELVRVSKLAFTKLVDQHPRTSLHHRSARAAAERAAAAGGFGRSSKNRRHTSTRSRAGCLRLRSLLAKTFDELGLKACLLDNSAASRPIEWFNAVEEDHDIVLYEADCDASEWTSLCLRQARSRGAARGSDAVAVARAARVRSCVEQSTQSAGRVGFVSRSSVRITFSDLLPDEALRDRAAPSSA